MPWLSERKFVHMICDNTYCLCYNRGEGGYGDMDWWIYVVVGLVVGMSFGYIVGIRRGSVIVGELIAGLMDGIMTLTKGEGNGTGS